jgi:hypothetical protein
MTKIKMKMFSYHLVEIEHEAEVEIEKANKLQDPDWFFVDLELEEIFQHNSSISLPEENIQIGWVTTIELDEKKYVYLYDTKDKRLLDRKAKNDLDTFNIKFSDLPKIDDLKSFIRENKINKIIDEN